MPNEPKKSQSTPEAGPSDYKALPDEHLDDETSVRVPTPDPKDQTGDPEEPNPAMRELRERQARRSSSEG